MLPALPARDLTQGSQGVTQGRSTSLSALPTSRFGHTSLSAAFRFVEPTWRNYIMYVDAEARAGNADALRYLKVWQSLPPKERNAHMPEQICELASVIPSDLVSWVARQAFAEGSAKANMCLSFMRDRVLEQTATFALASPDNFKDRELFLKASGSLPTPNGRMGTIIPIFNMPTASSGSIAGVVSEASPVDKSGLRDMDSEIVELSKIMQTGTIADRDEDEDDDEDDEEDDE